MARGSPREVKGREKEEGGVGAVRKTAVYLPRAGSGLLRPKGAGRWRPAVGHVGAATVGGVWGGTLGRGCPLECPDSGVAFPNPRSLLRTYVLIPQEHG